jgi:hypothetical protein
VNTKALISENEMYSPEVVCFCDIPVADLGMHASKYSRFGLSFLKPFLLQKGVSPVFYVAKNSTVTVVKDLSTSEMLQGATQAAGTGGADAFLDRVPRSRHFDKMTAEYHDLFRLLLESLIRQRERSPGVSGDFKRLIDLQRFLDFQVFSFLKCFDDAKSDEDPENFYMEREWRMLGNLRFELSDVRRIILPEGYGGRLRKDVPDYIGQVTFLE